MSYNPPRGPCSQKLSLLSTCTCYRFMIHPLKAATSFDCDGCGHHASFHRMQNEQDDDVARRWKIEEEREQAKVVAGVAGGPDEGEWRKVEELMEGVVPKQRKLVAASIGTDTKLAELVKAGGRENAAVAIGKKRKGR
ncbi:MAG: hypothetical protein Q9217_002581 [Psora testacea]